MYKSYMIKFFRYLYEIFMRGRIEGKVDKNNMKILMQGRGDQ